MGILIWEGQTIFVTLSYGRELQKLLRGTWQRFVSTKLKRRKWLLQLIGKMLTPHQQNHFGKCSLMGPLAVLCYVGCSHANNLKEYKSKKSVDQSFILTHKENFPQVASAKCECASKREHCKKCSCMSDKFLARAQSNQSKAGTIQWNMLPVANNKPSYFRIVIIYVRVFM